MGGTGLAEEAQMGRGGRKIKHKGGQKSEGERKDKELVRAERMRREGRVPS